ncbi:hypothetical protein GN956_G2006 [Arapaima gigas]
MSDSEAPTSTPPEAPVPAECQASKTELDKCVKEKSMEAYGISRGPLPFPSIPLYALHWTEHRNKGESENLSPVNLLTKLTAVCEIGQKSQLKAELCTQCFLDRM